MAELYPRVYIAQDFAEPGWSGLGEPPPLGPAYGHVDGGPHTETTAEEGQWDDISDAIAWGRERAPVVLVRVGYSDYHSAGATRHPDFDAWPPSDRAVRGD
jgi:hypothetical protein